MKVGPITQGFYFVFNLRNILSRYLIEFKIPSVIHCDNLCLCFFEFHCFGSKMLGFCIQNNYFKMLIIFILITKQIAAHFKGIKLWLNFIMKCFILHYEIYYYAIHYSASVRLIFTNFGTCLVFFFMSEIDRYGKWSDIQDLTTQEDKCCLGSLSLQNIWSIREELDLPHRVGTVIFGKKSMCYK